MKKNSKIASVLIYSIILVMVGVILATVVLNNTNTLITNQKNYNLNQTLNSNLFSKTAQIKKDLLRTNSNGSGFIDNIACPKNFTMSGTTAKDENISTSLTYSGTLNTIFYCSGNFNSKEIQIFFNSAFDDLKKVKYNGGELSINSGSLDGNISDSENTYFDLEDKNNYYYSDFIDDNFDSDNYMQNSSGSIDYPDNYTDDDEFVRKNIVQIIPPTLNYNIFWNSKKIEDFIASNSNNVYGENLGDVQTGSLFFETNSGVTLKIIKYDKDLLDEFNEIHKQNSFTGQVSGSGYIKISGNTITLDNNKTNSYKFNFKDDGYIIFANNYHTGSLIKVRLSGENESGTGIYINPINDSLSGAIKVLSYDVIEDSSYNLLHKTLLSEFEK